MNEKSGTGEIGMNRFGSHQNPENRNLYQGPPPSGLLRGTAAREFFSYRSSAGAPRRGQRHSSYQMNRVLTIPASKLNTTIFIGHGQKNLNVQGGLTPRASAPPKYDTT